MREEGHILDVVNILYIRMIFSYPPVSTFMIAAYTLARAIIGTVPMVI